MAARLLLFALPLAVLFGPAWVDQVRRAADPWRFTDDAQQHFGPFVCALQPADGDPCGDDYVFAYLAGRLPVGAHALYAAADPRPTGKALPFLMHALTLAALAGAAFRLGGAPAAWGALAVALSDPAYFEHISGALPRSFGLPLLALGALGLARCDPRIIAAAAVLGAAFYLPVGILLAAALALLLLLDSSRSPGRRIALLAATAAVMLALVAPVLLALSPYGSLIGPNDIAAFPEAGPAGRMADGDRVTDFVARTPAAWLAAFLHDLGEVTTYWLQAGVLLSALLLALRRAGARRLLLLPVAMLLCHAAATALLPALYVPGRYVEYTVPIFTAVALPAGLGALAVATTERRAPRLAAELAVLLFCIWAGTTIAKGNDGHRGLTVAVPEGDRALHQALAALPADALVAGWPIGPLEAAPYVSGRRVLVTREVHNPFHRAYVETLRRRTEALVDAYFAPDPAPLATLAAEFGATHLLIDFRHYGAAPPRYFAPFDARIEARHGNPQTAVFLMQLADRASEFRDEHRALISLAEPVPTGASPAKADPLKADQPDHGDVDER